MKTIATILEKPNIDESIIVIEEIEERKWTMQLVRIIFYKKRA